MCVTIHGPADALEPRRAAAMATTVLLHSIVKCNNRQAATGIVDTHLLGVDPGLAERLVMADLSF